MKYFVLDILCHKWPLQMIGENINVLKDKCLTPMYNVLCCSKNIILWRHIYFLLALLLSLVSFR